MMSMMVGLTSGVTIFFFELLLRVAVFFVVSTITDLQVFFLAGRETFQHRFR